MENGNAFEYSSNHDALNLERLEKFIFKKL